MPILLQTDALTKSYGDRLLFGDVSLSIAEGDKIGLVARNGTGKTTLLKVIAGIEPPDSGTITTRSGLRTGYLEQLPAFPPGASVLQACMASATGPIADTVKEYYHALENDSQLRHILDRMDAVGAWDYEHRLTQFLSSPHISDTDAITDTLSGGQRKRVALAAALLENPDLLILDEPTNHLDIEATEWLEDYLNRSRTTLLMVTHDRYFLERVCNRIIEIDDTELYTYPGNYSTYLRRRNERHLAKQTERVKAANTLRKEQDWINRQPQARAGKAKYRIDAYNTLVEKARPIHKDKDVNLNVESSYIGSKIFQAVNISKKFGDKLITENFSYDFARGEKVGIVGSNGVGKSTFVKMLLGIEPQDSGEWNIGETVKFGYYSQEGLELDPNKRVIDAVTDIADDIIINDDTHLSPMQFLKQFLFLPADQQKFISTLSGGERCRLQLAVVLMRSPNFLILDEPTNDLDIMTLTVLEEYLSNFAGCAIIISHDRCFLDNIADHIFVMQGNGVIKDFPGTYSQYREWQNKQTKPAESSDKTAQNKHKKEKTQQKERMTWAEKKEFETLYSEIEALSTEKAQLEQIFNNGGTPQQILEASQRFNELTTLLDQKEMRWLELSEKS